MGKREVKKELQKLDSKQLIELLIELYDKHKVVKTHLDFFATTDESKLLETYRKKVEFAFGGRNGWDLHLTDGKAALAEFKKLGVSDSALVDLYLYFTELGVQYTLDFGDIDERFYNNISQAYATGLDIMYHAQLHEKFHARAAAISSRAIDIGWGFGDEIRDIYINHFDGTDEDQ